MENIHRARYHSNETVEGSRHRGRTTICSWSLRYREGRSSCQAGCKPFGGKRKAAALTLKLVASEQRGAS